jgi:ArsR family transcriptional regulator
VVDRIVELHAEICRILGSAVRIRILGALRDGEKTVGELTEALAVNQANVSQHLAVLRQKRVVTARKVGTKVHYAVSNRKVIQACDLMRQALLEQLKEEGELTKALGRRSPVG